MCVGSCLLPPTSAACIGIEPLVRWLLTNNKAQIADYCNDKGFVSVVETTADSEAESIDGILMDDEDEFKI